ncbi:efflux RND transporter periplasmic adaptor subunit [Rhizobium sp. CNPSo 3490]|uniref:efflux RND transporter periplasmic adaptor subunit n=1 Tax=Rhizobium sp. CNPSo 3490 TaxID=3021407 RepID=UPI00254F4838|nr:efflux RND transporter periplasmic adaptor subunit [Rhizobium sp. CNPSo 3490]MDK4736951.1 efflux RND transporter periplasmic adaptor subunit [Rhizobium sp. CNPSo 3490]
MKPRLIISASLILALAACKEEQVKAEAEPEVQPVLAVVASSAHRDPSTFTGTIEPRTQANLGFRLLGRVVEQNAAVGALVRRGDVLARLDPVALELAARAAEAEVTLAEARFANAKASAARMRVLSKRDVASKMQVELAQEALSTAQAGLAEARARLAKAREQLGYTVLAAEFDGVVTSVQTEVGQVASPGQPVVTVAGSDAREAVIDVPDELAGAFAPGDPFEIALQVESTIVAGGMLREIAPQSDQATRTRRLRISLGAAAGSFRLGTIVTATPERRTASHVELPASGLVERDGKQMVWVIDPASSKVSLREVKIAARSDAIIEVAEGIADGNQVVVAGVHSLKPGQLVRISED